MGIEESIKDLCDEISKQKEIYLETEEEILSGESGEYKLICSVNKEASYLSLEHQEVGNYKLRLDGESRILTVGIKSFSLSDYLQDLTVSENNFVQLVHKTFSLREQAQKVNTLLTESFNDFEYDDLVELSQYL